MSNYKMVLGTILGCVLVVGLMIFGMSRLAGGGVVSGATVDMEELINGASLVRENGETKVTIVDFSDMQCPACASANEALASLEGREGVKTVFRHYPLRMHPNSDVGARAVEAARQMGKGWEMIDWLFENQNDWSSEKDPTDKFASYAEKVGIDRSEFLKRLDTEETKEVVSVDLTLGNKLKLYGTPSVFVNGELVSTEFVEERVNQILGK